MQFSKLELEHKHLFDEYFKKFNPQASELTFTNLFMWRDYYRISFTIVNNLLIIISEPCRSEQFSFMFIGNLDEDNFRDAYFKVGEYFENRNWKLKFQRIEEQYLDYFRKYGDGLKFCNDQNNSDYVYQTDNLINLTGRKYHGKRNHINRFKKEYEYEYVPLTVEYLDECRRIMDKWCEGRDCNCHRGSYCEKHANEELLKNYEALGCKGALIKVNGKFEAYAIGDLLNHNTGVVHIEKANSNINGLYTFINQQFCEREFSMTKYMNREQDMGEEGLRKAKKSYHPVKMVNKYTIVQK